FARISRAGEELRQRAYQGIVRWPRRNGVIQHRYRIPRPSRLFIELGRYQIVDVALGVIIRQGFGFSYSGVYSVHFAFDPNEVGFQGGVVRVTGNSVLQYTAGLGKIFILVEQGEVSRQDRDRIRRQVVGPLIARHRAVLIARAPLGSPLGVEDGDIPRKLRREFRRDAFSTFPVLTSFVHGHQLEPG